MPSTASSIRPMQTQSPLPGPKTQENHRRRQTRAPSVRFNPLAPIKIIGRNDLDLNEAWRGRTEAHRGVTVSGFPNFFMLYGPNTNLGHGSISSCSNARPTTSSLC